MKMVTMLGALVGATLVATPVMAVTLSAKERARVARAAPRDRDDVRYCLIQGKKGRDKGTADEGTTLPFLVVLCPRSPVLTYAERRKHVET